ncbi:MAG: hypothetical protein LBT26_03500 [Clostridiales Family XIII bacterium]|nr:hypothetical protein [Clostridiales Family XIII bacterium]
MKNNKVLPFERNRYYAGKLLTSADFLAEQTYANNKRRFINSMLFGSGIVCGLGVYNLDDMSVMVESGVAIDGLGREIALEKSVFKKLSALEGFESLAGSEVCLCLRYDEEDVQPVYSMGEANREGTYELNRVREGGVLFVTDAAQLAEPGEAESEFLNTAVLYEDEHYAVSLSVPAAVPAGRDVRLRLEVKKLSDSPRTLSMTGALQTPALANHAGRHEISLETQDVLLSKGEIRRNDFWLTSQPDESPDTQIIAKPEMVKIRVGGDDGRIQENFILKFAVRDTSPAEIVEREISRASLESRILAGASEYVRLADILLQRGDSSYIIESVDEHAAKQYIHTAAFEARRREYGSWFAGRPPASRAQGGGNGIPAQEYPGFAEPIYASGLCEIPLGLDNKKGDLYYSDEIMHGLGKGNIHVSVGFEYLAEDARLGAAAKNTIFGDPTLFGDRDLPVAYADTAVKVINDRGSFVAAARLTQKTDHVVLALRWVAVKLPSGDEQSLLRHMEDKSIAAAQPTLVAAARESCFIDVRFKNMEPCTLTYELTEKDSGEISSDGVYTAPNKEGVYEIRVSCADNMLISTYVYVVVKKKELED